MILGNLGQLWALGLFLLFFLLFLVTVKVMKQKEAVRRIPTPLQQLGGAEGMPMSPQAPLPPPPPPAPPIKKGFIASLLAIWDNKFKRFVGLSFLIGFIAVFAICILAATSSPVFCTRFCHSMAPVTEGWKASSHSEIPCINCHVESNNAILLVLHKAEAIKEPFIEITGGYKD